jgi:hypothetical protein
MNLTYLEDQGLLDLNISYYLLTYIKIKKMRNKIMIFKFKKSHLQFISLTRISISCLIF